MYVLSQLQAALASLTDGVPRAVAWFVLLALIFVPLERLFPHHRQPALRRHFGVDAAYYFLNSLGSKLLLIVPMTVLAKLTHHFLPGTVYHWAALLPFWSRAVAAVVAGDIGAYWAHRWSHQNTFLWRFHATHHEAEEMDWLVSGRAHPLDMVFTRVCAYAPLYLLGLAQPSGQQVDATPLVLVFVTTIWGFLIHANLNLRLGWIEQLVASPAFHHWHHTNDGTQVINKNYSALFPWVDRCFGSFYLPKTWPAKYGIDAAAEVDGSFDQAPASTQTAETI